MKDIGDLDLGDAGSVGGAMGSWPFRTMWWTCRWERTGQTDPSAVSRLMDENVEALVELHAEAERRGWEAETLTDRTRALDEATVDELTEALQTAYNAEWPNRCPFEREGSDMACHRCPVAAQAMEWLIEPIEEVEAP